MFFLLIHVSKPHSSLKNIHYHHPNKIFHSKLENPKIKISVRPKLFLQIWPVLGSFFFFLKKKIKSNPHIASAHSYTHFNRFTSTNFDQNFEILKLGIRGCVAILWLVMNVQEVVRGENTWCRGEANYKKTSWILNLFICLVTQKKYFGQFVSPLIINFYSY